MSADVYEKEYPLVQPGWIDDIGPARIMAQVEGYVMARRPGAMPFVLSVKEFLIQFRRPYHISDHAVVRYLKHIGSINPTTAKMDRARLKLEEMVIEAVPVEMKPLHAVATLIRYDYADASYLQFGEWILVIREGNIVATVYKSDKRRWIK